MKLVINGNSRDIYATNVAELIQALELKGDRIAIEQNGSIVSRTDWASAPVRDGDHFEIVHFVGGGALR